MTKAEEFAYKLEKLYPVVACPLNHKSAWELLVATILAAQCTDARVNIVTPSLFSKYPTIEDYAKADIDELRHEIRSINFLNNKAKNIKKSANMVMDDFGGEVPDNIADLVTLAGVARKTANVVLSNWFKKNEGFVVDTHVKRIAKRHGFTTETDPVKVEKDLISIFPQEIWGDLSTRMVYYGREYCPARGHECQGCLFERDIK